VNTRCQRLVRLCAALCLLFPAIAAADRWSAVVRPGDEPGVRLHSGLAVCDEGLIGGRWVNRYWLSTGMVKPEFHLTSERTAIENPLNDAFELAMEGQDLAGSWRWIGQEQKVVKFPAGLLTTVELESRARPIRLKIHTLLHGGPVMVRWLQITNTGTKPTAITRVSPWSGRIWRTPGYAERLAPNAAPFEVGYTQYQEWSHEGAWKFDPVVNGTKTVKGTRGKSGWGHPTFVARNRATGEIFVASLGWSGNWAIDVIGQQDAATADLFFRAGPDAVDPALRVLAAGETVRSPELHALIMRADLDHVVQALHDHVRANVLPPNVPGREFQVEANHRGYIVDNETEDGMKREVDLAADIGAEMFVIDAGWYGPRPNRWAANVGDWYPGEWLPNDITPVREYARKKGLLFGLWMEPESIGAQAKLRQQHPDWILTRNGKPVTDARQLDVANPAVAGWMEAEIERLIRRYDLDMFRIDYNTTTEEYGNRMRDGFLENTNWRHVETLYAMFDRLRAKFPKVIFQNCAGGGGRLDYGIMRRFHNTELSDWMRAPRSQKILNGMTWLLPPEILLRTFGTEVGDHATDGDLDQQLRTVLFSRPIFRGIAPTLSEFTPDYRQKVRDAVALYKEELRPIMVGSRVFHHTPMTPLLEPSPWVVLEYATRDASRSMAVVFRTSENGEPTYRFVPRGVDGGRTYRVRFGNSGQSIAIDGARLQIEGLPVRLEANLTSELLIFEAQTASSAMPSAASSALR
jgi:alpha-galactosidase